MGDSAKPEPSATMPAGKAEAATEAAGEEKATAKRGPRGRVFINEERCKGCGLCIAFCPSQVLERSERFNSKGYHPPDAKRPEKCTGCDICGYFCPDFAIYGVRITEKAKNKEANDKEEKKPEGPS